VPHGRQCRAATGPRRRPYDAVVLGSAVYAGHWLKPARALADRCAAALRARPVWLFSSGPVGDPAKPDFAKTVEGARSMAPDTVGPGYYALMRLDEFVASRVVEAVVHGLDLTDALGREPMCTPEGVAVTAAILDELLARRTVPGRPADLASDDLAWVRAASGRGPAHPDPRLPLIG
jgi:hypothetical protein